MGALGGVERGAAGIFWAGAESVEAGVLPVVGGFDEVGAEGVSFDVAADFSEVVGHDDAGEEADFVELDGLLEDFFEGEEVGLFMEDCGAGGGVVHEVAGYVVGEGAWFAGHGGR
jgi:hypothetical protein